jgi:hypothetical protein
MFLKMSPSLEIIFPFHKTGTKLNLKFLIKVKIKARQKGTQQPPPQQQSLSRPVE